MDKEINKALEDAVKALIKFICSLLKSLFWGIRKLRKRNNLIVFLISFLSPFLVRIRKDLIFSMDAPIFISYIIYFVLLFMPALVLISIGNMQNKKKLKYDKVFEAIGFRGKNGKYPFFINKKMDGKKLILTFKADIPLQEWKRNKDRLENGLDCTILAIENGQNKKIMQLTTVPSDYKIPSIIVWKNEYIDMEDGVLTVGCGALDHVKFNLNRTPHVLVAGETGSGKSFILRCLWWQVTYKECKTYMMDFKGGVEFGKVYEQFGEVVTDRERALTVLTELVIENQARLDLFREMDVKNLNQYNKKTGQNLSRICVFCDEIAEMLDKKGVSKEDKEVYEKIEAKLSTLARLSRATGINLIIGVQRPDANILPGQIKNNIPVRISGRFADKAPSEIVLGNTMAVDLPDVKGRFLYRLGNETIEFQGFLFEDEMIDQNIEIEPGDMLTQAPVYKRKKENEKSEEHFEFEFDFEK